MEPRPEPPELQAVQAAPFTLVVGVALAAMIDPAQGGTLFAGVAALRAELAAEQRLVLPALRCEEDPALAPDAYVLLVRDQPVAEGTLHIGASLAIETTDALHGDELAGFAAIEPASGAAGVWVTGDEARHARELGFRVLDATDVLLAHLARVACDHADELLERDQVVRMQRVASAIASPPRRVLGPGALHALLSRLLAAHVAPDTLEAMLVVVDDWLHAASAPTGAQAEPPAPRLVLVRSHDLPIDLCDDVPLDFLEQLPPEVTAALLWEAEDAEAALVLATLDEPFALRVLVLLAADRRPVLKALSAAERPVALAEQARLAQHLLAQLVLSDMAGPYDFLLDFDAESVAELLADEPDRAVIDVLYALPILFMEAVRASMPCERLVSLDRQADALLSGPWVESDFELSEAARAMITRRLTRRLGYPAPEGGLAVAWVPPAPDRPFAFLEAFDPAIVAELLAHQPAGLSAGVLALMDPEWADVVLTLMPSEAAGAVITWVESQTPMPDAEQAEVASRLRRILGLPD